LVSTNVLQLIRTSVPIKHCNYYHFSTSVLWLWSTSVLIKIVLSILMYSFKILTNVSIFLYQCTHSMLSKRSKYLVVKVLNHIMIIIFVYIIHVDVCTMHLVIINWIILVVTIICRLCLFIKCICIVMLAEGVSPKSTNYWYGNLCMKYIYKYINKNIKSYILVKLICSSDIHKYYTKIYAG